MNPSGATTALNYGTDLASNVYGIISASVGTHITKSLSVIAGNLVTSSGFATLLVGQKIVNTGSASALVGARLKNTANYAFLAGSDLYNTKNYGTLLGKGHNSSSGPVGVVAVG